MQGFTQGTEYPWDAFGGMNRVHSTWNGCVMAKRTNWDYCLELKGMTPATLPLARMASYLSAFAGLLGDDARPVFAGLVKGSAVMRATDRSGFPTLARTRMKQAATDDEAPARPHFERIAALCLADGARGRVLDREKCEVITFTGPKVQHEASEILVDEDTEVDGVVVGVEGMDSTAHIRLLDQATDQVIRIQVRDMAIAQAAARHFRGPAIRAKVHGKWRRDSEGNWHPHSLYADAIIELDQSSALDVFKALRAAPGNGWAAMPPADADALLSEMRGSD